MLYNKERLLALMDKHHLAGVVAATPENIYYLSGHASWSQNGYRYGGSQVYVVFPRDPAQSPTLLIPSGDAAYAGLEEVWLKEAYIYGRPRKPVVPDPNKLRKEEKRTLELTESEPKGATPEKALAQLIKDKVLQKGDIFRVDMGCSINGYHADVCKSGCVGAEPTDEQRKRYNAIQAGVLKSVERLKPGVLNQELFETMIAGVRANGIPDYSNFFVGHTIGLEAREFPFILGPAEEVDDPFLPSTSNVPMEPGMTVNLEASSQVMGWGSVQVEYTLAVTNDGHEYLIQPDQKLFMLPLQ